MIQHSTHASSQVISVEDSLVNAARTIRSIRNAFAPINKLPPEILTHVCTLAPEVTPNFAHLCAQVCRSWRNTLLASPSLWNEIHAQEPLHVEVHLVRSRKVPLEVYFHGGSPVDRFCQKVVPHMDRFLLLYLSLHVDDCEKILDSLGGGRGMPLLRVFHFKKASTRLRLSAPMMERISSLAANIATLILWNIDAYLSSLIFPRLLGFVLITRNGFEGPRVSDVIGFLRAHPMLEALELDRASYSLAADADNYIEPAALSHLESAILGGRPSPPSPDSLPYIEVDLLPYLHLPSSGQCGINISPVNTRFPRGTNYLSTLIRAWEIISGPGGCFGGGSGFTHVEFLIKESPGALTGRLELWIPGGGSLCVDPENTVVGSRSWLIPKWETTTTEEDPRVGEAGDDEFQAQLSRLSCYLDPLRWSPSPLAAVKTVLLRGFGYTKNKRKYLQYLRECFGGLDQIREFRVKETNPWMIAHLLGPFEDESGRKVLIFPLLELLILSNCAPAKLPQSQFLEVMKERAVLGNVLEEVWMDGEEVDLSELLAEVQERT